MPVAHGHDPVCTVSMLKSWLRLGSGEPGWSKPFCESLNTLELTVPLSQPNMIAVFVFIVVFDFSVTPLPVVKNPTYTFDILLLVAVLESLINTPGHAAEKGISAMMLLEIVMPAGTCAVNTESTMPPPVRKLLVIEPAMLSVLTTYPVHTPAKFPLMFTVSVGGY